MIFSHTDPIFLQVKKRIEAMWDSLDAEKKAKFVDNGVELDTKNLTILTRCNPSGFVETVGALAGEKVAAICEMGFGSLMHVCCTELSRPLCQQLVESIDTENNSINIHGQKLQITKTDFERVMGVKDGGQDIVLSFESIEDAEFAELRKSLYGENKEINVENLRKIVIESDKADEYFKISFVLYAISTVLCPSTSANIDPKLIIPLRDHANIGHKNWSTFCFLQLMEGIKGFHKKNEGYIVGSILFLQLFYCDLVSQRLNCVEKCMLPIVAWGNTKTKRLIKWIVKHGGLNCSLLFDYSELSTNSKGGQYISVGTNLEKQSMDEIDPMKSEVSIMMRETMDEFKKSMDIMKEDMVANIVAEVIKATQQPASKEVVKEKLITEVGVTRMQAIESEGGNDIRSRDPSELDSLIVVGNRQANPPPAPVSLRPEVCCSSLFVF